MSVNESIMQMSSPDKSVRAHGAQTLGALGETGAAAVIPLLASPNWVLRYRACEVLGLCGCKKYIVSLSPLLTDPKDHVRYMAAKSIGLLGTPADAALIRPLTNDENPFVVRIASAVLHSWNI